MAEPSNILYEEEMLRNHFDLKQWWRYLVARADAPFDKRSDIYERALKALPGSYRLWQAYLREWLDHVRHFPISHHVYGQLNSAFERALVAMNKMPRIWIMYLTSLTEQRLISLARRTFDRALCALPVTQHDRIWPLYLILVSLPGVPLQTSLRVYRRYVLFDPSFIEDFIDYLLRSQQWQEAAKCLASVLGDDSFHSSKGKTRHLLWLELCDLITHHATEVSAVDVDAIVREGIRKHTVEIGYLWNSLANYYVRRGLCEKARDIFEEGLANVITARDFSVIFDSYVQFEHSALAIKIDRVGNGSDSNYGNEGSDKNGVEKLSKRFLEKNWLNDDDDVDLRLARLENLFDRRPELLNNVLLRQNPHNVEQWHRRVKLFEGNPTRQILTFTEALRTVDPMKAVGKPHTLWVSFARFYENHNDIVNARIIFDRAVQVNYKTVDNLASVWCEWAEMELRHKNFQAALELMRWSTAEPSIEVKRRVAMDGSNPVQMRLQKSLRLWSFYVDMEESFGTLENTRAVYERILDQKIATPQIILNYAFLLEEHKYFKDAFKVYERGVKIFKYPHVKDIWITYLSKFVKRYGMVKLERARGLFEDAIEKTPAQDVKPFYLQYAKLEEDYGLAKRAMKVYDQAVKAVSDDEKMSMYEIYIARAAEIFGVSKTRKIYEQAIESGLPDNDVKTMCLKYAELERNLGEFNRARAIFVFASQFVDSDSDFWKKWYYFEAQNGTKDTFREMLRIKRSVLARFCQTHVVLPEYLMQKDHKLYLEEVMDTLKRKRVPDEMVCLERQLAPSSSILLAKDGSRMMNFVSPGVQSQPNTYDEDIELPEESDLDNENVAIAQKDVPGTVFYSVDQKKNVGPEESGENDFLGALGRIKRKKRQQYIF